MPVSDETKDFLDQVKKGKPRKFVMLVKGTEITSLVMFKKGAANKFIKEAKADGKGVPVYGVATGKGMDINFQLAVADGFDKKPVKDLVLKKFLEDEADFKCKPLIEIVETAQLVLDPDDPLHAKLIALQGAAQTACETHPDEAQKLNALCRDAGAYLDADRRKPAEAKIAELEDLLKSLSGGAAAPTDDRQQKTYEALRAKLEPLLLGSQRTMPDKAAALMNVWQYANAQAAKGNYAGANKALAGLADALTKAPARPTPTSATTSPSTTTSTTTATTSSDPDETPNLEDALAFWRLGTAAHDRQAEGR
ncbi:MAG: hypothetical protein QM775_14290 [Pirellulales bacterium]